MSKKMYAMALGLALAVAAGCGDDDGGNNGQVGNNGGTNNGGSGPATAEEFNQQAQQSLLETVCEGLYECPEQQSPVFVLFAGRFADKQECLNRGSDLLDFEPLGAETRAALAEGRLVYNQDKAEQCLAAFDTSTCPNLEQIGTITETGVCSEIYTPQQAEGDACVADDECVTGFCDFSATNECYGNCALEPAPVGEGESCSNAPCADGLVCVTKSDFSGEECVQRGGQQVGENCSFGSGACADGLVCGLGSCTEIPTLKADGESCNLDDELCTPGFVCANLEQTADGGLSGTCSAPIAQGESCGQTFQCAVGLYCESQEGQPGGTCQPTLTEGDACDPDGADGCGGDLECVADPGGTTGTCQAPDSQQCVIPSGS